MPKTKKPFIDPAPGEDATAGCERAQVTGDAVLIRQAWRWFGQWHQPLVVGAAVTLVGLAYVLPIGSEAARPDQPPNRSPQHHSPHATAEQSALRLPTDAQFYRDQWARDAQRFYALHPPRQNAGSQASSKIVPAAAASDPRHPADSAVSHAYRAATTTGRQAAAGSEPKLAQPSARANEVSAVSSRQKRWRVVTCLAAGMLASLAFATVWPAVAAPGCPWTATSEEIRPPHSAAVSPLVADPSRGEAIAIALRLPAAWVRVRPTLSQTLRRGVFGGSCLLAALGGWSLVG